MTEEQIAALKGFSAGYRCGRKSVGISHFDPQHALNCFLDWFEQEYKRRTVRRIRLEDAGNEADIDQPIDWDSYERTALNPEGWAPGERDMDRGFPDDGYGL